MKQILTNTAMYQMRNNLKPFLSQRNMFGYIVARNYRMLSNALIEYERFKNELIQKYGERDKDEDGNLLPTMSVKIGAENFDKFCEELEPYNAIEHEVDLMTIKYSDIIGILSGDEILSIDWMLED